MASVMGLSITVVIAWLVHRLTRRIARIEHGRELKNAWIAVDNVVFGDEALLRIADQLTHAGTESDSMEVRRKRWICLMLMNPLSTVFTGISEGLLDERATVILERELYVLVRDDMFFALSQEYTYEPEFAELCRRLRNAQPSSAS
ncbi:hypothetical protein ACFYW6_07040 [Streptomyces sp. NPDC002659]|uniref:hypothetical protein n=1 Tax=Streptomyces sp. NPDC002659 TaxID=3364656 RepID=UPI00369D52CA